jgi:hypothetical protein
VPTKLVAVAAIVVLVLGYFLGLWSDLAGWLSGLWYFLAASTLVPNWLLGIFAICAIVVAGLLGAGLRPTRHIRRPLPISTQDNFFNIRWRWSYDASGGVSCSRTWAPLGLPIDTNAAAIAAGRSPAR